jgi:hypothetical protein
MEIFFIFEIGLMMGFYIVGGDCWLLGGYYFGAELGK